MSKVFIVRFHVIQFTRYSVRSRSRVSLFILTHVLSFVKNFFQVFSNFFSLLAFVGCPRGQLRHNIRSHPICQYLFSKYFDFFQNFFKRKKGASCEAPLHMIIITPHHRSSHSHHHFCGKQQRNCHHYPHPGRRRSYDPADSSATPPPRGSWV